MKQKRNVCVFTTIPQILSSANARVQVLHKKGSGAPGMGSVLTSYCAENETCFLKFYLISDLSIFLGVLLITLSNPWDWRYFCLEYYK